MFCHTCCCNPCNCCCHYETCPSCRGTGVVKRYRPYVWPYQRPIPFQPWQPWPVRPQPRPIWEWSGGAADDVRMARA